MRLSRVCARMAALLLVLLLAPLHGPARAQSQESMVDWSVLALLPSAADFDAQRVAQSIRERLTTEDKPGEFRISADRIDLAVGMGSASILLGASPVPAAELQEACRHATWYWRAACSAVQGHGAHVRVVLRDTRLRKVDSAVLATRLLAAVTASARAVATLWGVNLQSADAFQKAADSLQRERVPVMLWINFRYSREPSGNVSVITRGMPEFELMEIESRDTPYPGKELVEMIMSTSQRLVMKGSVIGDGETIGGPPGRRVHVRFADSLWTPGRKVYRVEIGG